MNMIEADKVRADVLDATPPRPAAALNKVLVATDFSRHAAHAVDRVAVLANQGVVSSAVLLHARTRPPFGAMRRLWGSNAHGNSEDRARALEGVADELRIRSGLRVEDRVEAGSLLNAVHNRAAAVDLVVVGAPGDRPLRDVTIGSTAGRIARSIDNPLLVVRRRADVPYRRVIVAVDFEVDPRRALAYAQAIAPSAGLNLVHAYRAPYEGKMHYAGVADDLIREYRARAQLEAAGLMTELVSSSAPSANVRVRLAHGDAAPKLLDMERELAADLVVVTKRPASLARELMFESVTEQLLRKSQGDLLIVR